MTWQSIPGYIGRYEFNPTTGKVRSVPRDIKLTWSGSITTKRVGGRLIKPIVRPSGRIVYRLGDGTGWRDVSLERIREMCDDG